MSKSLNFGPSLVERIHGVSVADPYRWLEDRSSIETTRWIAQEQVKFQEYFRRIQPMNPLRKRVQEFADVETIDQIGKVRNRYFYRRRSVGQEQASIYVMDSADNFERVLVDASNRGVFASIGIYVISSDASLLAYEVKQGGEHFKAIHFIDVSTGKPIPDHLSRGLARGVILRTANDGFYYCHESLNDPDAHQRDHVVGFHRFGTPTKEDLQLLTLPRTRSSKLVLTNEGEQLGAIYCHELAGRSVVDLFCSNPDLDHVWNPVCLNQPAPFSPFFFRGRLFAHDFQNTPNGQIVELDFATGRRVRIVVPEWNRRTLQCSIVLGRLYVTYLVGTETVVRLWSFDGTFLGTLSLEEGYTWSLVPGYASEVDELLLQSESFTRPPTIFRYLPNSDERIVWNRRHAPDSLRAYVTQKHTFASKDGIQISISLLGALSDDLPKCRPTIMTAYGGFGITMTPQFSTFISVLLELGFLFAIPQVRGGGEHGKTWHEAARGRNRQVAFEDFCAAGDWLCERGFTEPRKLAIFGGSNSGLLVGAAITRRPDLFRAALCIAPLLDMIRYHLFDRARVWSDEYGTSEDPEDFRTLLGYSPYHNVLDEVNYPAVLFVCGDKDTRCNPAHARKMTARLKDRRAQTNAILIDHTEERGHSPTMPFSVRVDGITRRIAFLCHELGVPIPEETYQNETHC